MEKSCHSPNDHIIERKLWLMVTIQKSYKVENKEEKEEERIKSEKNAALKLKIEFAWNLASKNSINSWKANFVSASKSKHAYMNFRYEDCV